MIEMHLDPKIFDDLDKYANDLVNAEKKVVRDAGKRAPSWVAQEVSSRYGIIKAEMTFAGKGVKKPWGSAEADERFSKAGVGITSGDTIESFCIEYRGRLLTPFHFGLSPKLKPAGRGYTMKATIKKGSRQEIGHYTKKKKRNGPYAQKTGALFMLNGEKIPGFRASTDRNDIKVWKTLSVPQMVTNEETAEAIGDRLTMEVNKLCERYFSKIQ